MKLATVGLLALSVTAASAGEPAPGPPAIQQLTASAREAARLGHRDEAWADALEAERLARQQFQSGAPSRPDASALWLEERGDPPLDLVLAFGGDDDEQQVRAAWDRLIRWRGLVRDVFLARRSPRGERAPSPDSVSLDAVLARLGPGEALISFAEYRIGDDPPRMAAFVAGYGAPPRRLDLGASSTLRSRVTPWLVAISTPPRSNPRGEDIAEREAGLLGEIVSTGIWEPVLRYAAGAKLVHLVGDGPLLDVPWLALPGDEGGYLAESGIAVRVLGSERELLRARPMGSGGKLLVVADPEFGGTAPGAAGLAAARRGGLADCARWRPSRLAALPGARDEAREAVQLWRTHGGANRGRAITLMGAEASEAAFRREAVESRVIQVVTHGVAAEDSCAPGAPGARDSLSARRVWLALAGAAAPAPAGDETQDGLLTAEEVLGLDLRGVDCLVLSGSHSGPAAGWPREAALDMSRAFRLAGVRSVIASGWSLDAATSRDWIRALDQVSKADARDAAMAARAADRSALGLRRRTRQSTHPYYWAAFTSLGE